MSAACSQSRAFINGRPFIGDPSTALNDGLVFLKDVWNACHPVWFPVFVPPCAVNVRYLSFHVLLEVYGS